MSPFFWIPLLIGGSSLGALAAQQRINQQNVQRTWQALQIPAMPERFSEQHIQELPEPVQRYFRHAIAPGTPLARAIELTMQGQFRLKADAQWMAMQAQQILALGQGLVWQASVKGGWIHFSGADICDLNQPLARIQFSLWGLIPFVQASSADILRSALGRLALESVWLPTALLPQFGVQWRAIDDSTIQASWMVLDEPITITLKIDPQGRVHQGHIMRWSDWKADDTSHSPADQPKNSKSFGYVSFGIRAEAESTFDGLTIPNQLAALYLPETSNPFEFFRATVTSATPVPPSQTSTPQLVPSSR